MFKIFNHYNIWLGKRMFYLVWIALMLGFLAPVETSKFWSSFAILAFGYMTFTASLETSFKDFINKLSKPSIALWVLLFIHIIMPVLAYIIGLIFYPANELIRLGFIIGAAIPIGVTSLIWSTMNDGDIALSMVLVTLDTLICPILLPIFIVLVAGKTVEIDMTGILLQLLLMITVPSLLGMLIHDFSKLPLEKYTRSIGGVTSKLALAAIIYINTSPIAPKISWDHSIIKLLLVVLIVSLSGYALGFICSYLLKGHSRDRMVTMIYSIGMRNIGLGQVLALTYFPPEVALPATLSMLYQQPLAALVAYLLRRFKQGKQEPIEKMVLISKS